MAAMTERDERYNAAASMIDKLARFSASLDDDERAALHALLIPGVAHAFEEREVSGHSATTWSPGALPDWLTTAMQNKGVSLHGVE